jgi:hypothetical protein
MKPIPVRTFLNLGNAVSFHSDDSSARVLILINGVFDALYRVLIPLAANECLTDSNFQPIGLTAAPLQNYQ